MKILLTPIGSHGDVHPFVGLGVELTRRGHRVIVIANPHFQPMIKRAGLAFAPLGTAAEYREAIDNPAVWDPVQGFRIILGYVLRLLRPLYECIVEHHEPGETVVVHSPLGLSVRLAHEKLGIRHVTVHLAPSALRSVVDPPVLPGVWLPRLAPGFVKRFIYWIGDRFVVAPILDGPLNEFRAELGLPPIKHPMAGWWNSPQRIVAFFPEWFAPVPSDWPQQTRLCGFPLFDERGLAELPDRLEEFLQAGEPPILFTPGSAMLHGQAFFKAAVGACARMQRRAILLTLHPENLPSHLPDTMRTFRYIPFSQVFPRTAAVVHHGGIGTTSQGLAAGVPQLIMPMGFDQPDNAARLERLGVGAALYPRKFTGPNVAAKLESLLQPEVRRRCQDVARRFENHRALERACEQIEEMRDLTDEPGQR